MQGARKRETGAYREIREDFEFSGNAADGRFSEAFFLFAFFGIERGHCGHQPIHENRGFIAGNREKATADIVTLFGRTHAVRQSTHSQRGDKIRVLWQNIQLSPMTRNNQLIHFFFGKLSIGRDDFKFHLHQ